ncbi:hypothetical protein TVAG_177400 [Trichomonas vaginalis G3]|uniref:Uncharacterized protein n=1 Tax=Trichomonas vaginalis (strain ATCC PRA-98 / G3) TaxID=412133 RepID=A2FMN2_TRIV3|nr:hypothetical protein TVAGG3_1002890 [Trichomonas vaginalis G3]EAX93832.1 hypothetical protein TVAG_177400 [Trichomonas vaginalis G3]KAI5490924.1 hypothetical protein TVAGG3_1002890 [Trichomonas vaginalis G3]|eukprot:XP_001306762.1 hypothetical protein [Trichomonas vaginalis G3]
MMNCECIQVDNSIESVKKALKIFSKNLRRDFLVILVKIIAIELKTHTIRKDWRTREGSLEYLSKNWLFFRECFSTKPGLFWFCTNFDSFEGILSNRDFVIFMYRNWYEYSHFISTPEFLTFLRSNARLVLNCIKDKSLVSPDFPESSIASSFIEMLDSFHQRKTEMVTRSAIKKISKDADSTSPEIPEAQSPTSEPIIDQKSPIDIAIDQILQSVALDSDDLFAFDVNPIHEAKYLDVFMC